MRRILVVFVSLFFLLPVIAQEDALQSLLNTYRSADGPATVLYVQTPTDTVIATTGKVEVGKPAPVTADSRFRIASVSKAYVAVAVLQLVDEGQIDLDAPISDYLPQEMVDHIANTQTATVRNLLNMTSGMYEYLNGDWDTVMLEDPQHPWTARDALQRYAYDQPAEAEAGTVYEYTNTNYVLLQVMLEGITQQSLPEILKERIFDPIGATQTYVQTAHDDPTWVVHGYEDLDEDGIVDDVTGINDGFGLGDGAIATTASDLARFYQALFVDKTLLSDPMLQEMLTDPLESEYGMGMEVIQDPDYGTIYGHSGLTTGFTSDVRYYVDEQVLVILLCADLNLDDQLEIDALNGALEAE